LQRFYTIKHPLAQGSLRVSYGMRLPVVMMMQVEITVECTRAHVLKSVAHTRITLFHHAVYPLAASHRCNLQWPASGRLQQLDFQLAAWLHNTDSSVCVTDDETLQARAPTSGPDSSASSNGAHRYSCYARVIILAELYKHQLRFDAVQTYQPCGMILLLVRL
jgi:hypothetical protein